MNDYIKRLRQEKLNLIILNEDTTLFTSSEEGMKPLIEAINRLGISKLEDAIVVDKIVGKAAALLISYFKAKKIHCIVLSMKGRTILDNNGIKHNEEGLTPEIMNRRGTDLCPFEQAVRYVDDPLKGYERISTTLKALGIS